LGIPILFTAPRQVLRTRGNPSGDARALLKVDASTMTTAIDGLDRSGIVLEGLRIDGGRPVLGKLDGQALIEFGGNAADQTVRNVAAGNTRSWSTLHVTEGGVAADNRPRCRRATISGNTFGPAGTADGNWADGISLACADSVVRDNVIRDATDGAIVVFGAPGSTVEANTIIAAGQTLLGAINMVDFDVTQGSYEGVKVTGNTIDSQGALIKVGIGMGPQVWFCQPGTNYGATVTGNTVKGDKVGYSFPVNGVRDWTVAANVDLAHHVGLPGPGCGGMPSAPGGFQVQAATNSTLQPGYSSGAMTYLLGLYEAGTPPTGCGDMYAEQPLPAGRRLSSGDKRFSLSIENGRLVLGKGSSVLWSAGNGGALAVVRPDGNFTLQDANGPHRLVGGHSGPSRSPPGACRPTGTS
jgi:hypothetical protein